MVVISMSSRSLLYRCAGANRSSMWSWRSSYLFACAPARVSALVQLVLRAARGNGRTWTESRWPCTRRRGRSAWRADRRLREGVRGRVSSAHSAISAHDQREGGRTEALRAQVPPGVKHLLRAEGAEAQVAEREPEDDGAARAVVLVLGADSRHGVCVWCGGGREAGGRRGGGGRRSTSRSRGWVRSWRGVIELDEMTDLARGRCELLRRLVAVGVESREVERGEKVSFEKSENPRGMLTHR